MKFGRLCVRGALAALFLSTLTGCPTPPTQPAPAAKPAEPARTAPVEPLGPGRVFQLDPAQSEARILVYRGGTLAKLGHNHVIASHDLSGTITVPEDPTATRFEIVMPVASLAIDEAALRAEEGADFATTVNDSAREGTHRNLMKPEVLDGERYPALTVRSKSIAHHGDDYDVTFDVSLRGASHEVTAPVHEELVGDRLKAQGEFAVKQTDLGLTPFTAAMGALAVKDEIRVRFRLEAVFSAR